MTVELPGSALSVSKQAKAPEPLRRAITECTQPHGSSPISPDAERKLQDYLSEPGMVDAAYSLLVEHALAEKDRSPGVVVRTVALLKRYIVRYNPSIQVLESVDYFCRQLLAERKPGNPLVEVSPAKVLAQAKSSLAPAASGSHGSHHNKISLAKSLLYVRALVARRLPTSARRAASGHLSAGLTSPAINVSAPSPASPAHRDPVRKERGAAKLIEIEDAECGVKYIARDLLAWRWTVQPAVAGKQRQAAWVPSPVMMGSGELSRPHPQPVQGLGASSVAGWALKAQQEEEHLPAGHGLQHAPEVVVVGSGGAGIAVPSLPGSLLPDTSIMASHISTIAAAKRVKTGPAPTWGADAKGSTVRPRSRPLFQYRHYSEQVPLDLSGPEMEVVMSAVCSPEAVSTPAASRKFESATSAASDVAASVLIKLIIDMYLAGPDLAGPLTLSLLLGMLESPSALVRQRAFDLVLNLGVHAHLLQPLPEEIDPPEDGSSRQALHAVEAFEDWLLPQVHEMLLFLLQVEECEESVWAAGLSCLLYLVCERGRLRRRRLQGLDLRVVAALLQRSRAHSWAEGIHTALLRIATNLCYSAPDQANEKGDLLFWRLGHLGGIHALCNEYAATESSEACSNLFAVLLDYLLLTHKEALAAGGQPLPSNEEVAAVVAAFALADAPRVLQMAMRGAASGVGEGLAHSVLQALARDVTSGRLNAQLVKAVGAELDAVAERYRQPDPSFAAQVALTLASEGHASVPGHLETSSDGRMESEILRPSFDAAAATTAWETLRALLHSDHPEDRGNGQAWLLKLLTPLLATPEPATATPLQLQLVALQQGTTSETQQQAVTQSVQLFRGLLESSEADVQGSYLWLLGRLLLHCQVPTSKAEPPQSAEASAMQVLGLLSAGLWHFMAANNANLLNMLKVCDFIFAQLCVRRTEQPTTPVLPLSYSRPAMGALAAGPSPLPSESSLATLFVNGLAYAPTSLLPCIPTALLWWPFTHLPPTPADAHLRLAAAVGSRGGAGGGSVSDYRAALLVLLIGKCLKSAEALQEVGGDEFFEKLLDDVDARVAYHASTFCLKRMMTERPEEYRAGLQQLVFKAQQRNNEKLLENPYLQMRGLLQTVEPPDDLSLRHAEHSGG